MNSRIALIYENKTFRIEKTGEMIEEFKNYEDALKVYEEEIEKLNNSEEGKWLDIKKSMENFIEDGLIINDEYKNLEFKGLKYFLKTDKLFFIGEDMIPLTGGFTFFKAALELNKSGEIGSIEELVMFLKEILISRNNYRLNELSLLVLGAAFNYGSAEFNFQTKRLNKGASIEDCTFEKFKEYVLNIVKK